MKYINADKLIAEINKRLIDVSPEHNMGSHRVWAYNEVKSIIDEMMQGEPTPTGIDKVEPKFKVGDWIVEPRDREPDGLWHIDRIVDGNYWSEKCGCTIEHADKNFLL